MKKSHSPSMAFVFSPTPVLISLLILFKNQSPLTYTQFFGNCISPPEEEEGNYERRITKDVKRTYTRARAPGQYENTP